MHICNIAILHGRRGTSAMMKSARMFTSKFERIKERNSWSTNLIFLLISFFVHFFSREGETGKEELAVLIAGRHASVTRRFRESSLPVVDATLRIHDAISATTRESLSQRDYSSKVFSSRLFFHRFPSVKLIFLLSLSLSLFELLQSFGLVTKTQIVKHSLPPSLLRLPLIPGRYTSTGENGRRRLQS